MFDFYQKRKLRALLNSPFTQGILVVLVLLASWSAYVRFEIASEMSDRRLDVEAQVAELRERQIEMVEEVNYLESERGVEAEMRRQFDVALPGEQVVVIVEDETKGLEVKPLSTTTPYTKQRAWYQFWR
jgi:cell division protein FtsB